MKATALLILGVLDAAAAQAEPSMAFRAVATLSTLAPLRADVSSRRTTPTATTSLATSSYPHWTFAGTVEEATVAYLLGKGVANSTAWPAWNPGNEYEALREKTNDRRAARKGAGAPKVRNGNGLN